MPLGATAGMPSSAAAATNVAERQTGPAEATHVSQNAPHRKLVKHFDEPGDVHELTFSCYRRMPLLTNDGWRRLLYQAIDRAVERHDYRLFAFVLMPEHVHLIVQPQSPLLGKPAVPPGGIDDLLFAIKRPYSYRIKTRLIEQRSELLKTLTIRQRPGVMTFRYWQEGPGYDRNLKEPRSIVAAIDHVHMNPVRRGPCQRCTGWKWSSARYFLEPEYPIDPDLPRLTRLPPELLD
jgi:putative transposase